MAEAILSSVVGSVLEVLGSQLLQEVKLASGVQNEIRELRDTFETINSVLLVAEKQFNQNEAVAVWLRRLKGAVYDADDLLDDFYTQLKMNKEVSNEVRIFFSQSNQIAYSLKIGHKIQAIRERLERIKSDGQLLRFNLDNGDGINYFNRQRETHSFECEENVIGRDDDKKALLQLLLKPKDHAKNNVSIISIVGIGGVGKTTLVQSIYNVEEVKNDFELRMWVCVSDDFTLKTVVEKILKSATRKEIEKLEIDQLQDLLHEQINRKKYLLILDDVWNADRHKWLKLHTLLKNGAKGSKILVTTRMREVANIMSKPLSIHLLKGLTEEKSWDLFKKIAFKQGEEPKDSNFEEIGKNIVAKCVGVPLAIRTIGNLLYGKDKEFWLSLREKKLSEIPQKEDDILPILKLSYYYLSSGLKQCFAYCALFPKDYEFEKENLIQLWMAQGFLGTSKKKGCLEDVGNEYFMDLLSGSFLQDLRGDGLEERIVIKCKMHDLMHDLAQSVVGSEIKMVTNDANGVDERSRHISFAPNLNSLKISIAMLKVNHLRTFLPLCSSGKLNKSEFDKILSNFSCLRTLKLSNLGIKKVPTSIGKLKLLRYLNLSQNEDIEELPNSLSKLVNLQTLDLHKCSNLKNLPGDIRKMVSLQYLMIDGCESLTSLPCGLGQLTDLRILSLFVVGERERKYDALPLRELNGLDKLRGSLTIKVLGAKKDVNLADANLEEKQYLKSIRLKGDTNQGCDKVMVEGLNPRPNLKELSIFVLESAMFSGHRMSFFTNLTKITISSSRRCRSITPLDQSPSLVSLIVDDLYNLEYISESDRASNESTSTPAASTTTFFPSLNELRIIDCCNLKGWWKINDDEDDQVTIAEKAQQISFHCLSQLHIWNCPAFTSMPLYPTLETLDLLRTSPKPLKQTMKTKMKTNADADATAPSTSYSAFSAPALSNLKFLNLECIHDFESLSELLQRATSLVKMDIFVSQRLTYQSIRYLSSDGKLTIDGYDHLNLLNDDDDKLCKWQGLRSLCHLEFREIQNMVRLPKWVHHITTLQHLEIHNCRNLMGLPEEMQLEKFEISNCRRLSERCGNKKCVDWPKIAHIPNIQIDDWWIQLEGCYQGEDGDEP